MFRSYPNNFGYRYKNWSSKFKQASHRFKTRIQSFYPYPSATSNCITPKKSRATHQTTFQPQGPQGHKNLALCLLTAHENHTQNKSFLKNVTSFHYFVSVPAHIYAWTAPEWRAKGSFQVHPSCRFWGQITAAALAASTVTHWTVSLTHPHNHTVA